MAGRALPSIMCSLVLVYNGGTIYYCSANIATILNHTYWITNNLWSPHPRTEAVLPSCDYKIKLESVLFRWSGQMFKIHMYSSLPQQQQSPGSRRLGWRGPTGWRGEDQGAMTHGLFVASSRPTSAGRSMTFTRRLVPALCRLHCNSRVRLCLVTFKLSKILSHQIFGHMHIVLNMVEKNPIA